MSQESGKLLLLFVEGYTKKIGGGDYHFFHLKNELKKRNDVDCLSISTVNSESFNLFTVLTNSLKSLVRKINSTLVPSKTSLVLCEAPYPPHQILSLRIHLKYGIPLIVYYHHYIPLSFHPFKRGIFRSIVYFLYNNFTLTILKVLGAIISLDYPTDLHIKGITCIPNENALPLEYLRANPNDLGVKTFDLCYVGRFEKHKGSNDLIKVVSMLREQGINLKVIVIGQVKSKTYLKTIKLLNRLHIFENFTFAGVLSEVDKINTLMRSKIYISLSYEEGWGLSVMQAAALLIPIVAYDLKAYSYLSGNIDTVQPGDVLGISEKIKDILIGKGPSLLKLNSSRKLVLKYSYEKITESQLTYFRNIVIMNSYSNSAQS